MPRRRGSRKGPKLGPSTIVFLLFVGGFVSLFNREPADLASNVAVQVTAPSHQTGEAATQISSTTKNVQPDKVKVTPELLNTPPTTPITSSFVKGRKVALRDGPGKQFGILDRYDTGREVTVLGSQGDWSEVQDKLTQREGWISRNLLTDVRPREEAKREASRSTDKAFKPSVPLPQISDVVIVQRLIAESIFVYPGSCACPYNTDRGGRRCGKRSAYNRGGGYAPICFAGDVSKEMIASFREQDGR